MNSYNITDIEKLKLLFDQAFSSCPVDESQTDYDEYIALVAEGRADLLPKDVRSAVLDRISYDSDSASLLKELEGISVPSAKPAKRGGFRVMSITWAMAATLMFGLFMWRIVIPPQEGYSIGHLNPYSTTDIGTEYWNQAHKQRLVMDIDGSRWRDYALLGSISATCVLSVVLLTDRLKRRRG
jgi:hypothetical protein